MNFSTHKLLFLSLHLILFSNLSFSKFDTLLLLIPYLLGIVLFEIKIKLLTFAFLCSIFLTSLNLFLPKTPSTYFSLLFDLNGLIINWIKNRYSSNVSSLINLILFNDKNNPIFKEFLNFGIAHIVSISGFHFSILRFVFFKIFKKNWIVFFILFFYWSIIGFTISALRVLLFIVFRNSDIFKTWSLSVLFSLLFNFHIYTSLAFLISYFIPFIFFLNKKIFFNIVAKNICNYWVVWIYSTAMFLPISKKIYPFYLINFFLFSIPITFMFVYFLFTWFIVELEFLHSYMYKFLKFVFDFLTLNKSYIFVPNFSYFYTYFAIMIISVLYMILIKKKVCQ